MIKIPFDTQRIKNAGSSNITQTGVLKISRESFDPIYRGSCYNDGTSYFNIDPINLATDDFTFEIKFRRNTRLDTPTYGILFSIGADALNQFSFYHDPDGILIFDQLVAGVAGALGQTEVKIKRGKWHTIAFTKNVDVYTIYLDGAIVYQASHPEVNLIAGVNTVICERNNDLGTFPLVGTIQDLYFEKAVTITGAYTPAPLFPKAIVASLIDEAGNPMERSVRVIGKEGTDIETIGPVQRIDSTDANGLITIPVDDGNKRLMVVSQQRDKNTLVVADIAGTAISGIKPKAEMFDANHVYFEQFWIDLGLGELTVPVKSLTSNLEFSVNGSAYLTESNIDAGGQIRIRIAMPAGGIHSERIEGQLKVGNYLINTVVRDAYVDDITGDEGEVAYFNIQAVKGLGNQTYLENQVCYYNIQAVNNLGIQTYLENQVCYFNIQTVRQVIV